MLNLSTKTSSLTISYKLVLKPSSKEDKTYYDVIVFLNAIKGFNTKNDNSTSIRLTHIELRELCEGISELVQTKNSTYAKYASASMSPHTSDNSKKAIFLHYDEEKDTYFINVPVNGSNNGYGYNNRKMRAIIKALNNLANKIDDTIFTLSIKNDLHLLKENF